MGKRFAVSLCTLVVLAAGCGHDTAVPNASPESAAKPSVTASESAGKPAAPLESVKPSTPSATAVAASDYGPQPTNLTDDDRSDIDTAVWAANGFWQAHWSQYFTGSYRAPTVSGLYDGNNSQTAPTCAGRRLGAMNAFYCKPDNFVAWDEGLMNKSDQIGDAFLYLVVAHEWGHAIQNQLVGALQSVQYELQADCLAGAALYGAMADEQLHLEKGDERELTAGLTNIADETAWTATGDHGDPFQRIDFFNRGRTGGPGACFR